MNNSNKPRYQVSGLVSFLLPLLRCYKPTSAFLLSCARHQQEIFNNCFLLSFLPPIRLMSTFASFCRLSKLIKTCRFHKSFLLVLLSRMITTKLPPILFWCPYPLVLMCTIFPNNLWCLLSRSLDLLDQKA